MPSSRPATSDADGAAARPLAGRTIVLGVSGSIAAYKAAELLRLLVKAGADVHVVLTRNARRFVAPLTFQTLSGHRVVTSTFDDPAPGDVSAASGEPGANPVEHVDIASRASLVVVAPATANVLAKLAHGMADDALSTLLLAVRCPVLLAPAMNTAMYEHPATAASCALLVERGCHFVEGEEGELACRTVGRGRLAEPAEIAAAVERLLTRAGERAPLSAFAAGSATTSSAASAPARRGSLAGRTVLVTAGRTEEPLDPVRVLTNRSSGKMGFALAQAARDRGARVVVVAGVTSVEPPGGVEVRRVQTASEMSASVRAAAVGADAVLMAAAVSDYRPAEASAQKIERGAARSLSLEPTEDILAGLGRMKRRPVLVGFALETGGAEADLARAREKLRRKQCDLIVLNNPTAPGAEIGGDTNIVTLISADGGAERLPCLPKLSVAERILDRMEALLQLEGAPAKGK